MNGHGKHNNRGQTLSFPYHRAFSAEYNERSLNVLELAINQVAAYQSWTALDPGRQCPVEVRYAALPALTKQDIREHFPGGMLPSNCDVSRGLTSGEIEFVKTSGSTGDSVTNIWNQKWWDASEKASWQLNSYTAKAATGDHREAILVNPLNVGIISDEVELSMEKRRLARFLYLNERTDTLSWPSEHMDRMIRELEVYKPVVLEANASYLAKLSRYIAISGRKVFQPELIVFTYEYPTGFHLKQIRKVFDVPLVSSYGTTEVGCVFMGCEAGKFHQNSEFCRVDFQPFKPEHGGPYVGRILVTTFNNPWYVMVHFDVGDLVRLESEVACPCGRGSGLILSAVEGRVKSVTLTCKSRLVTLRELDNALSILKDIDEYHLDQAARDTYCLHLVSQRTDRDSLCAEATEILRELYGDEAKISILFEKDIVPLTSGKYITSQALFPINIE
ncbi:MAG: hypothetical protein V1850_03460, partial [Candidatus Bathyarchaeota archaeon]